LTDAVGLPLHPGVYLHFSSEVLEETGIRQEWVPQELVTQLVLGRICKEWIKLIRVGRVVDVDERESGTGREADESPAAPLGVPVDAIMSSASACNPVTEVFPVFWSTV
jgi:hypothetical protein